MPTSALPGKPKPLSFCTKEMSGQAALDRGNQIYFFAVTYSWWATPLFSGGSPSNIQNDTRERWQFVSFSIWLHLKWPETPGVMHTPAAYSTGSIYFKRLWGFFSFVCLFSPLCWSGHFCWPKFAAPRQPYHFTCGLSFPCNLANVSSLLVTAGLAFHNVLQLQVQTFKQETLPENSYSSPRLTHISNCSSSSQRSGESVSLIPAFSSELFKPCSVFSRTLAVTAKFLRLVWHQLLQHWGKKPPLISTKDNPLLAHAGLAQHLVRPLKTHKHILLSWRGGKYCMVDGAHEVDRHLCAVWWCCSKGGCHWHK